MSELFDEISELFQEKKYSKEKGGGLIAMDVLSWGGLAVGCVYSLIQHPMPTIGAAVGTGVGIVGGGIIGAIANAAYSAIAQEKSDNTEMGFVLGSAAIGAVVGLCCGHEAGYYIQKDYRNSAHVIEKPATPAWAEFQQLGSVMTAPDERTAILRPGRAPALTL